MARIDRDLALAQTTDRARWSDPTSLEPAWDARAELAARFVSAGTEVLDLGCGRMALQQFLPFGCGYQGCDLVARDEQTIVCDFNAGQFPTEAAKRDSAFTSSTHFFPAKQPFTISRSRRWRPRAKSMT